MKYAAVSLFSGCGGFSEGARLAGFVTKAAVERDPHAAQTYSHNFPDVPLYEGDVAAFLNPRDPKWHAEAHRFGDLASEAIDVVYGGPPCQGYSQIGTRLLEDPRNRLYLEFLRVLTLLRPRVFIMENVPNMLLLAKGRFKAEALSAFRSAGYSNATVRVITASQFGVPQVRRRAIFLGFRDDLRFPFDVDSWLDATLARESQPEATVWEAIGDLPEGVSPNGGFLPYPPSDKKSLILDELRLDRDGRFYRSVDKLALAGGLVLHQHHTKEILDRRKKLIAMLGPGAKGDSLPPGLWNGKRPEKWRRLHPDRPAYTILAQMHRDLSEWVHPRWERWITVREAARLQSFHDGFVFRSSEWQMLKQIGNAVPPLMARAICSATAAALQHLDAGDPGHPRLVSERGVALRLSL